MEVLFELGADPRRAARDTHDSLCVCASYNQITAMELLISYGVDVHARLDHQGHQSALEEASRQNSLAIVDLILDTPSSVSANILTSNLNKAMRAAVRSGHIQVVQQLLRAGAAISHIVKDSPDQPDLLFLAAKAYKPKMVEFLLSNGVSPRFDGPAFKAVALAWTTFSTRTEGEACLEISRKLSSCRRPEDHHSTTRPFKSSKTNWKH
ncbi:Ankyrin repeat domain-containing protein 17 [Neophaeococcomyces mojaviensis]|uniref:Ankyrin repeat domain-containing protein 17 n=1 Tax=Neophaeococcomyces mojaviensis TaxID=3383035 RepID=A0ACC3AF69_9EURO|nr:Ankyrin repeat domain-containing protein 17 [Knufia sp. JES_112]